MMKKWIIALFTSLLLICGMLPVFGDGEDINISTEIGFDKVYRANFLTPITITVENNMKDIDGEIQIEIPSSFGSAGVDRVNVYAIAINHPKNTTKKYTMNIPIPSSLLSTKLRIVEGKKTLIEQNIRTDLGIANNVMLAGIMSDNSTNLNYLNGFTFQSLQGNVSVRNVNLNEENFSEDMDVMRAFNVIFMNDYDSSKLSDDQYNTLKRWVEQGGFLVIGTGPNGSKTLSAFRDDFITGERGGLVSVSGKKLGEMISRDFNEPMEVMDIKLAKGAKILEQDGIALAQYIDKNRGRILVLSFDMGLEPLSSWNMNRTFMEVLVQRAAPSIYTGQFFEKYMAVNEHNNYLMTRALKIIPEISLPNHKIIIALLVLYIILAAPVSYIILKKRDRRELMWAVVPMLSVAFMIVIYFMGFGTRLSGPVFNKISIIYGGEDGSLTSRSFGGVLSPKNTNLFIEGLDETDVKPFLTQSDYYNSYPTWNENRKIDTKIMLSPKSSIEVHDVGAWTMKTFSLDNDKEIKGEIHSEISYVDSGFRGFIENNTDLDLEDCYIITSSECLPIGDIKSGERKEITGKTNRYYGDRRDLLDSLYDISNPKYEGFNLSEEELFKIREIYQKRFALNYYLDNYASPSVEGVKFLGWSSKSIGGNVKINGKEVKTYEKSLLITDIKLMAQSGEEIELPWGYVNPVVKRSLVKGGYESYDDIIHNATGTVEVAFNIIEDVIPERISLNNDGIEANIKQYIWNVEKNQWDSGDFSGYVIEGDDLGKYLDNNNSLLLKYELSDNDLKLPQIKVKGRVK